jgi:hypothetical protein
MQIVSLGVYGLNGERRDVAFRIGALNILTGKSKTGKSAILDIIEYCLGRNTVTIPTGVISDHASWYYVLVQFDQERVLICRPNPEGASTQRAMIMTGGLDLGVPAFHDLQINADTDVIKDVLTERLGIESFVVDRESGSLRQPFEVSVRHALLFCFQNQGEIASRDVLFHRQVENEIKTVVRDSLPYFLGAATPEQGALRRQLIATRRTLQRVINNISATESDLTQRETRISSLVAAATALEILPSDVSLGVTDSAQTLLERISVYDAGSTAASMPEEASARQGLVEESRQIRSRLREIDDRVDLLKRLQSEQTASEAETDYQVNRLRALDLMVPRDALHSGDVSACPLCDQQLEHADETIEELRHVLDTLSTRLQSSSGMSSRRDATIDRLVDSRVPLIDALRENTIELDAIARQEALSAAGRQRREQVAFLQGRVSQELERGIDVSSDLAKLKSDERRYRGQLARLEDMSERDDPALALRSALDSVSELMTDYARYLELEGSDHYVRLDASELTVAVQRPGGRVPLNRMGSAENWVGYHLVAHLALHHWFASENRPVPRFLLFDQPTQAFFPEEVVDSANDENADWEAVRRQFSLMNSVVHELAGDLQVIVCDHANLADDWFQQAVVENWRNGVALIPSDWLDREEGY